MATPRGYSSYRGRTPKWKILTAVLLILVILLAVGYLVVQEHLVYDDSGIPHLDLPGWKDKKDTGGASSDDADASLPEITIEEPKEKTLAASELSSDPAQWAAEWSALKAEGCRAAVLPVKLPGGHVNVSLEAVNAAVPDAVAPDALGTEDLRQLLGEDGIYAVARISCFRDGIAGRKLVEQMGLKNTGGYIFYDGNNENWIDPGKEAARTYLTSLAAECASLGFREILLCDVGYPTVGKLSKIDYGEQLKSDQLRTFLDELRAAMEPYSVKLSVELSAEDLRSGSNAQGGLVLAELAPRVDRVWASCTAEEVPELAQQLSGANREADFVPELTALPQDYTGSYLLKKN